MIHKISAGAIVCALFAISMTAYAQGRPAGAGNQGGGGRPAMSQQQTRGASMRQDFELRRQQTEARRLAAEDKRLVAESAHIQGPPAEPGGDHNRSAMMRDIHPPSANAAPEAKLPDGADGNADNKTLHGERRNVQGVTQRVVRVDDDGDEADPD